MNPRHRTPILAGVVVLAAIGAVIGYLRLDARRASAVAAERDLRDVHVKLAEITAASSAGNRVTIGRLDESELSRRLNAAAADANVADKLSSITPMDPKRLGNTDYNEREVVLYFKDFISLQQLTVFLHTLAQNDPGSRAKQIELELPEGGPGKPGSGELWTASVSVAYLIYAPKENKP